MNPGDYRVLLVDDDPNEVFLVEHTLQKIAPNVAIQTFRDGREVVDFLRQSKANVHGVPWLPTRTLMLLDLKMPRMSGFEVLEWTRRQPELSGLVVMVMSNSDQPGDIAHAYELGCNAYLVKPWDLEQLTEMLRLVLRYSVEGSKELAYEAQIESPGTVGLQT